MNQDDQNTVSNYTSLGEIHAEFNHHAYALELLSMSYNQVNKIEVHEGIAWECLHLDVPAIIADIGNKRLHQIKGSNDHKKARSTTSYLTNLSEKMASKAIKSKVIAENHVRIWVSDYFEQLVESLVDSITLIKSETMPGSVDNSKPDEHTMQYKIMQDSNEWLVSVSENKSTRPKVVVTMNGLPANDDNASVTTQWIAALFSAICINKAHAEILSFYRELAQVDSDSKHKAKQIAECIGGNYYDYLIIAHGFNAVRQTLSDMPEDMLKSKADYVLTVESVLELTREELDAVVSIFIEKPMMQ